MKVALCFFGQPRFFKICSELYFSKVIEHYKADVFIHTWFSKDKIGQQYPISGWTAAGSIDKKDLLVKENLIDELNETYKPKKIKYEWYDPDIMKLNNCNVMSQYYSQHKVCELKKEYEKENNFKYDLIIRSRFDYVTSYFYDKVKDGYLNIPDSCPGTDLYCDTMSISNNEIYETISQIYNMIKEQPRHQELSHPNGEYPLRFIINHKNIPVNKMPIAGDLIRITTSIPRVVNF